MVSENLTVTVNAITATAQAKLNRLRETVQSLGRASVGSAAGVRTYGEAVEGAGLKTLGAIPPTVGYTKAVDESGDEAFTSALQIGSLTSALSSLTPAASGASVSIGVLSASFSSLTVAVGVVTGALVVFGSVVAAIGASIGGVIAGAGALATAFTGIIGTGILAFGKQRGEQAEENLQRVNKRIEGLEELREEQGQLAEIQKKNLTQLKDRKDTLEEQTGILGGLSSAWSDLSAELTPIITRFGEEFAPLIRGAIDTLPRLVDEVLDAAGGLSQLKDDVAALGAGFADALPGIVAGTVDLAREAMPAFKDFVRFIGREGPDAISFLVQTAKENAPEFKEFLSGFADALPDLIAFGNFIIGVLVPALSGLGQLLSPVTKRLGKLNDAAKQIPDWVIDILKGTLDIAVKGGPLGKLVQDVFVPAGRRRVEEGPEIPSLGITDIFEQVGRNVANESARGINGSIRGPAVRVPQNQTNTTEELRITGELVERDGEIKAVIDERVETNNRRSMRKTARKNGESKRRPR